MFGRAREIESPATIVDRLPWVPAAAPAGEFRLTLKDLPHAALIVGRPGVVVGANAAAEELLRYGAGQLVGQPVEQVLPEASNEVYADPWEGIWALGRNRRQAPERPLAAICRDGSVAAVDVALTVIGQGPHRYLVASLTDAGHRLQPESRVTPPANGSPVVERELAELGRRLATAAADSIDEAIAAGLGEIGEALQVDSAAVWWTAADAAGMTAAYRWTGDQRTPLPPSWELPDGRTRDEGVAFSRVDDLADEGARDAFVRYGCASAVMTPVPVAPGTEGRGLLVVGTAAERTWTPAALEEIRLLSALVGQALARKAGAQALQQALGELEELRERGASTDRRPVGLTVLVPSRGVDRSSVDAGAGCWDAPQRAGAGAIIGQSAAIRRVLEQVEQVAATDSTVLLLGETGSGKELLATHVHALSARRGRTMVRVNCSAIPATLMESELFGRERGAYTGALARQIGRFELADQSTIFLDEIGDLPAEVQVKLLRVLEERQFERLGSPKAIHVNVRIVAATHRDLEQRIVEQSFREDLFYRLNVFPIRVPALRDRADDIPLLVWRFVDEFSKTFGKRIETIARENMQALQRYPWPGNIRELRNVVERAMIIATGPQLKIAVPTPSLPAGGHSVIMADVQKEHIRNVLESTGWRIRGAGGAAERLGLRPTTLETRMARLGIVRPKKV